MNRRRFLKNCVLLLVIVLGSLAFGQAAVKSDSNDVYLFTSFRNNGQDGLYLAYSRDGLNWTVLNDDKPFVKPMVGEKLMRDPCIIQGPDGIFHMVWTTSWHDKGIGIAHSRDLVNWSEQKFVPVMAHEAKARNCWAPEITWDPDGKQYVIYWATSIPDRFTETAKAADKGWNHRMYCTTTKDFKSYTPTRLFYNPGFNVIDSTILRASGKYVMITKDETRYPPAKNLHIATSDRVTGPWSEASEPFTPKGLWVEGPTTVKVGEYWYVYYDCYRKGPYGAMRTRDFKEWQDISDKLKVPKGMRHGTVLAVSKDVLDGLLKKSSAGTDDKAVKAAGKPNIIVIYTDDQGFGDASCLNPEAKFQTPNLDRLAKEGISFTNGHSADTVCTPSRYGLLTGRYCWRTEKKTGVLKAENTCLITDGRVTLASLLRDDGYNTAMVGKWHLGMDFPGTFGDRDWSKPVKDMPLDKGFDYFYGIPASLNYGILAWFEGRYAKVPPTLYTSKKKNKRHVDYRIMPPYYKTPTEPKREVVKDVIEVAPDFIDNQCLTRFTDKAIEWMKGKAGEAKNGKPFFVYLPFTSPHYPVCPKPEFWGKGKCGGYGEFVIETDHHVGRILDFLKKSGLDENTMIVFSSDNGPERSWKGRIEEFGHDSSHIYTGGKRDIYEGGHRMPFFVRWPSGIKEPGRKWDKIVGQVDLLATIAELLDAKLPANAGEDSQSFAAVLNNPKADYDRQPLINHASNGRFAITERNWKLILPHRKLGMELYDLNKDPEEKNNIASKYPAHVERLKKKLTDIVVNGRTTPGAVQLNDTGYWDSLEWISETEYNARQAKIK